MRIIIATSAILVATAFAGPAVAQQQQGGASVDDYLCQFADKCVPGTTTPPAAAPTSSAAPTERTSQTRGFRLARSAPAAATQSRPVVAAPVAAAPVATGPVRRSRVTAQRPSPAPGLGRRVNLLLAFDYNSDRMTAAAQAQARVFAQALMTPELRDRRFLIEGHTDARGSRALNLDLSRRRAQAVADFLVGQGVNGRNLDVRGLGSQEPLPGRPADADANRRVEAILLS